MYAYIFDGREFYISTVYAFHKKGYNSSVIVLNKNNELCIVKCFSNHLTTGIKSNLLYTDNTDGWVKKGRWEGYDFLLNDSHLIHNIKKKKPIDKVILEKAKAMQTQKDANAWVEVNSMTDANQLLSLLVYFHDSKILDIKEQGTFLSVKFRCLGILVTLRFFHVLKRKMNFSKEIPIFDAQIDFSDNEVKWYVESFCYGEKENQECMIVAKKMDYRIEPEEE